MQAWLVITLGGSEGLGLRLWPEPWKRLGKRSHLVLNRVKEKDGVSGEGEKDEIFIPNPPSLLWYRASFFERASFSPTLSISLCCINCFPLRETALSVVQLIYNVVDLSRGLAYFGAFLSSSSLCLWYNQESPCQVLLIRFLAWSALRVECQ